jgi:hypothetical protein
MDTREHFYIAEFGSNMTIIKAWSLEEAIQFANNYIGRMNEPRVKEANEQDVSWNRAMGGCVHDLTV